ncbi:vanadium-dependent haloperoxidase [Streptomyces sp. NPDC096205]|uniref:vanadium-dependent haloperoxidase n=1 Tax=Streptomyces sp. NPDC096205 TaxID=3366081 RepID=UPI00380CA1C4
MSSRPLGAWARASAQLRRRTRLLVSLLLAALLAPPAFTAQSAAAAPASAQAAAFDGRPVQYWNSVLLDVFRRQQKVGPGPLARAAAMMNAAIYDAESAYQRTWHTLRYEPYLEAPKYSGAPFLEGPNEEERVIGHTARNLLVRLFPAQATLVNTRFKERFGNEWTDFDVLKPLVAEPIADRMWNTRYTDGWDNRESYTVENKPGAWRPTGGPGCTAESDAVDPNWGLVRPFALSSGAQFRPATPETIGTYEALMASPAYRAQVDEVRLLGSATSTARTTEQTAAAWFWANDADGTYKPPGQMLDLTRIVADQRHLSVYDTARAFALVSLAMADGAIAEWDVKYRTPIDLWRPVSAVQVGLGDTTWQPLGPTPCFPAWASGHATFAGAWQTVMNEVFGTDQISFTATTDDLKSPVRNRTFSRFSDAAEEDALSRLYLGVHYRWDAVDGLALGRNVGSYVVTHELRRL